MDEAGSGKRAAGEREPRPPSPGVLPPAACCACAVERAAFSYDQPYDYAIPPALQGIALPGCRVLVPFGPGRQLRAGVLLALREAPPALPVKPIAKLLDDSPLLPPDLAALIPWLAEHCFCTLYEAFRAMVPVGLRRDMQVLYAASPPEESPPETLLDDDERRVLAWLRRPRLEAFARREALLKKCGLPPESALPERMAEKGFLLRHTDALQKQGNLGARVYRAAGEMPSDARHTPRQTETLDFLRQNSAATMKELCGYLGVSPGVVQALLRQGAIEEAGYRGQEAGEAGQEVPPPALTLTPEQERAYRGLREAIERRAFRAALLYGVTGSGKTNVYLRLIDDTLAQGRGVIVLVPEISLTPQLLGIFARRFGGQVALFHSAMPVGERTRTWQRAREGRARVVLGTRSAVFAPLGDIGLIVLDEEHEHTYKSEQSPRYHAREVAKARAQRHGALLLLCSATPSVESYAAALQGRMQLEVLPRRYGKAVLPRVRTVDILGEESLVSRELQYELRRAVEAGRQAILLMNRRGYHTFLACNSCKQVIQCPQCSISLTYHLAGERLLCHYCGYSVPAPEACPACGKMTIRFGGAGTQKIEDELRRLLPGARVARLDADCAGPGRAREEILTRFAGGEYDILVGTQMVAKGLDFENVTLVGVVSIDQQLYFDDYRSLERSFALLTQVVGRAGRGEHPGLALVQTINPNNEILRLAETQDYPAFFAAEIKMRRLMTYPPYCDLCLLGAVGENEQLVKAGAKYMLELLRQYTAQEGKYSGEKVIALGPTPARVSKVNLKYRWRLLIKCKNNPRLRALIAEILVAFGKDTRFSEVNAYADMNPENIL